LSHIVGYLMPPLKSTRMEFYQAVYTGRKKTIMQKDVPARKVPGWDELAVKKIHPMVIE
jgi:hypothetical protein